MEKWRWNRVRWGRLFFVSGEKKRQAFLDLLIESAENGVVLSDKEVREQVDTIMFEVRLYFSFIKTLGTYLQY